MAYNFNSKGNEEFTDEELSNFIGGIPYEVAKEYALNHGFGDSNFSSGELTEEELDNVIGGIPYEQSSGRRR